MGKTKKQTQSKSNTSKPKTQTLQNFLRVSGAGQSAAPIRPNKNVFLTNASYRPLIMSTQNKRVLAHLSSNRIQESRKQALRQKALSQSARVIALPSNGRRFTNFGPYNPQVHNRVLEAFARLGSTRNVVHPNGNVVRPNSNAAKRHAEHSQTLQRKLFPEERVYARTPWGNVITQARFMLSRNNGTRTYNLR